MRSWQLKSDDPKAYVLAADARCSQTDYTNDQIWELRMGNGEPQALSLETTYGLRARNIRIFPMFIEADSSLTDPLTFSSQPIVNRFYPNYLALTFSPFLGIDVIMEYWVPHSQAIAGRILITNSRLASRKFRFELAALLSPTDDGNRMAPVESNATTVLAGNSGVLYPVIFMTGGPQPSPGPYPGLSFDFDLASGGTRKLIWVHAGLSDLDGSFELARSIASRKWDAEIAHLDILNAGLPEIYTGNPEWDIALALTQKTAFSGLMSPSAHLKQNSFVLSRQPDQGFSPRGDGTDYSHLWNGQPVLEADFLTSIIAPSAPHIAQGILDNFLDTQSPEGVVDWKPGLGGQQGRMHATPLLANITWRIYNFTEDLEFLNRVFPKLLEYIHAWFSQKQDRDGDGIPEWSHPMQSGFDDHPAFAQWQPYAQGTDISKSESPALCAFLFNEINIIIQIAKLVGRTEPVSALESLKDNLKSAIDASWNSKGDIYRVWDRETHKSPRGENIGDRIGPGEIILNREFKYPVRLIIKIQASDEVSRPGRMFIHGVSASGEHRVESLQEVEFRWYQGIGNVTSERVYISVERVEIQGISEDDQVLLSIADFANRDHTLLIPLWAGIPDRKRAEQLIVNTILEPKRFWRAYGIPASLAQKTTVIKPPYSNVHIPWNQLIGEGLLRYGYRDEAALLVTHLMDAIIHSLKKEGTFHRYYHAITGEGLGDRHALSGLAPIGLFLNTIGINIISPNKIGVRGYNPYPWPVRIRYRGLSILREEKKTKITFPGGQTAVIKSPDPKIISVEPGKQSKIESQS